MKISTVDHRQPAHFSLVSMDFTNTTLGHTHLGCVRASTESLDIVESLRPLICRGIHQCHGPVALKLRRVDECAWFGTDFTYHNHVGSLDRLRQRIDVPYAFAAYGRRRHVVQSGQEHISGIWRNMPKREVQCVGSKLVRNGSSKLRPYQIRSFGKGSLSKNYSTRDLTQLTLLVLARK